MSLLSGTTNTFSEYFWKPQEGHVAGKGIVSGSSSYCLSTDTHARTHACTHTHAHTRTRTHARTHHAPQTTRQQTTSVTASSHNHQLTHQGCCMPHRSLDITHCPLCTGRPVVKGGYRCERSVIRLHKARRREATEVLSEVSRSCPKMCRRGMDALSD